MNFSVNWTLRIIGGPPPPLDFCKNYLYEGIDLETWNLACDTLVPSLVQEKYEPPPDPPFPVIFHFCKKPQKFYISIFGQKESKKGMVPLNKNCREGPHLVDEKKFQPDRMKGLEVMEILKTADSYTSQIDDFGKYAISVNMEAFILG